MHMIDHPSSNYDGRGNQPIDMVVLHYTGMQSGAEALARLCDADAGVSAHYLIEEDGRIFQLVDEGFRAWHAGVSSWRGHSNINHRSVGVEIVNPGHEWGYRAFPQTQMDALISLCYEIVKRHRIPARNVVGHSDVAPLRKQDPGELFDWEMLAKEGIGLWPKAMGDTTSYKPYPFPELQGKLQHYGYGMYDAPLGDVIAAFQRHFRPADVNGVWDGECEAVLESLLKLL